MTSVYSPYLRIWRRASIIFSPCVLPLMPVYVSYLTGVRVEGIRGGELKRGLALKRGLGFVFGFSLVFVAMGASAAYMGQLLFANRRLISILGGVVVFLAGLHLMGFLPIKTFLKERRLTFAYRNTGIITSVLLGIVFAAGWTPAWADSHRNIGICRFRSGYAGQRVDAQHILPGLCHSLLYNGPGHRLFLGLI